MTEFARQQELAQQRANQAQADRLRSQIAKLEGERDRKMREIAERHERAALEGKPPRDVDAPIRRADEIRDQVNRLKERAEELSR